MASAPIRTAPRLLVVNADDFGLNSFATDGILECHVAGSVSSTTLMVNAPDAERAVQLALQHPNLGVGLHFNITWGAPVSLPEDVRSIVDTGGRFFDRTTFLKRLAFGRISALHVRTELRAQLKRFIDLGLRPTHVDSHQHVHGIGKVFDVVATECLGASLPMRVPWVSKNSSGSVGRRLRRAILAGMVSRAAKKWEGQVRWNDALGSVFDLGGIGVPLGDDHYGRLLKSSAAGSLELMVHPVTSGDAMEGYTRVGAIGEAEWRYLRMGRLSEVARGAGFRMGTFSDLAL